MKNKVVVTIADEKNLPLAKLMETSLRKFHTEEELPLIIIGPEQLKGNPDPNFFYRATPIIGKQFLEEYETVIKIDADSIITGKLDAIWEEEFDVATVLNDSTFPIGCWDIKPYYNNGLVVMKSKAFVDHWLRLCFTEHFDRYQFKEQDLLNILCSDYLNYKVKNLDGEKLYGESSKPDWIKAEVKDNKLVIGQKELCVIHFAGGNSPDKGNYRIKFKSDVVKFIDKLLK